MAGPVWENALSERSESKGRQQAINCSNSLLGPEPVEGPTPMPSCYILRCADASYYVGSTHDLPSRLSKHAEGSASSYTAARRPVTLVYSEEFAAIDDARSREQQIKGWTRAKKEALTAGAVGRLKALSRSKASSPR